MPILQCHVSSVANVLKSYVGTRHFDTTICFLLAVQAVKELIEVARSMDKVFYEVQNGWHQVSFTMSIEHLCNSN